MALHFWSIVPAAVEPPAQSVAVRNEGLVPACAAGIVCWLLGAGVYVAAKWASADMPPWTLTFWRPLIAGVILLPLVAGQLSEMRRLLRTRWVELLLVGGLGLSISQGFIYTGLHYTSAVNAGLIMSLAPIVTLIAARYVLKEALGPWQAVGSVIALAGMVVIIARGDLGALLRLDLGAGGLWMLGAVLCFTGYSVLLRRAEFELARLPLLVLLLGAGVATAAPFFAWEWLTGQRATMNASGLLALAYVAIPGGAVMYYLYNYSVDVLGASKAGVFLYLQIFFVALLAWIFLGEHLDPYHYEGGAMIVLGVVLVTVLKPNPRGTSATRRPTV
jgi:drug/metabolite transporter (DMT)-like permease